MGYAHGTKWNNELIEKSILDVKGGVKNGNFSFKKRV